MMTHKATPSSIPLSIHSRLLSIILLCLTRNPLCSRIIANGPRHSRDSLFMIPRLRPRPLTDFSV